MKYLRHQPLRPQQPMLSTMFSRFIFLNQLINKTALRRKTFRHNSREVYYRRPETLTNHRAHGITSKKPVRRNCVAISTIVDSSSRKASPKDENDYLFHNPGPNLPARKKQASNGSSQLSVVVHFQFLAPLGMTTDKQLSSRTK
jgi:hypothetical protein